ncbi:carboxypeptidase regulatory-like domain-containing protein [Hymenobacter rubidus]|uniref:carboxypeptidase regulatory-like domain-containing protein n=1 Tax=Hymenobacter rubidus TaxID=1441626 RepID=UPI00191F565D|nr:carboxypeptidase regulatory-like domain-containing protein [Hymenobacter rubidus]
MRLSALLLASVLTGALSLSTARAQSVFASNATFGSANTDGKTTPDRSAVSTEKVVLSGKITSPAGPLPGAVVFLTGTKEMAVTNANGEFEFTVPANAGPLQARVTYAGYADENMTLNAAAGESTVTLANARVIVISRKQQLKKYLKTAHKQVKRELRKARG